MDLYTRPIYFSCVRINGLGMRLGVGMDKSKDKDMVDKVDLALYHKTLGGQDKRVLIEPVLFRR